MKKKYIIFLLSFLFIGCSSYVLNYNGEEVNVEETIDTLQETDPWLKRKMESQNN